MFTGIVQGIRKISLVSDIEGGRKFRIQLDDFSGNLEHGASVAVNGVCLTTVKISQGWHHAPDFQRNHPVGF
jgi:riboflavin synthase